MPVGDFPTVFPTIMTCWLNRMVTSENGIIHMIYICAVYITYMYTCTYILDVSKRGVLDRPMTILHFLCIFCQFCWLFFCADQEHVILANTCTFYILIIHDCTILHVFCILWHCLLSMERFGRNLHANSAYLQYMEDTGRSKMRQ